MGLSYNQDTHVESLHTSVFMFGIPVFGIMDPTRILHTPCGLLSRLFLSDPLWFKAAQAF